MLRSQVVSMLLHYGSSVNTVALGGWMPLQVSCAVAWYFGRSEASVSHPFVQVACENGRLEVVKLLISKGADLEVHTACNSNIYTIQCTIQAQNDEGMSPLLLASSHGHASG